MRPLNALSLALPLLQPCSASLSTNHGDHFNQMLQIKRGASDYAEQQLHRRQNISSCNDPSCFRYYNSKTKPYFIESWPDVDFETGEFYSGNVVIDEADPLRTLFFIFKPAEEAPVDEVTIWLNGGPGCSSLEGFFEENGPILWQPGTQYPRRNEWAWSKLTNMLWIEQPVGTGFATGRPRARNEVDVAEEFLGFFKNWQELFDIKNYKIYLTGESYAGRYIPYIGAQMLDANDAEYFDLSGALLYDPCIGDCFYVQAVFPTYYFILNNNQILNLDDETLEAAKDLSEKCGYNAFMDKWLQFPPPGNQPTVRWFPYNQTCAVYPFYNAMYQKNPCFNIYHITDYCPFLYNPLERPYYYNPRTPKQPYYFNRVDVKRALHAPVNVTWYECAERDVFHYFDWSPNTNIDGGVLPQIIEGTNRVLISNGDWDALLPTNGTLLSINNMTWNGALGFQSPPSEDFIVPFGDPKYRAHPQGVMGKMHYERGLQWVETYQAGHMQPQYQPRAAFRHLQWMLKRIDSL